MAGRNGARPKSRRNQGKASDTEDIFTKAVQDLADFEEFRNSLLPALRADLMSGMSPDEMRKKYKAIIQARLIQTAITADDGAALSAAKDILDRSDGKATEKKEVTHRLSELSTEELKAILISEEQDVENLLKTTTPGH